MAKVFWVSCPSCTRKYYVSTSLQGAHVELMCPFCKTYFPNPSAAGQSAEAAKAGQKPE